MYHQVLFNGRILIFNDQFLCRFNLYKWDPLKSLNQGLTALNKFEAKYIFTAYTDI